MLSRNFECIPIKTEFFMNLLKLLQKLYATIRLVSSCSMLFNSFSMLCGKPCMKLAIFFNMYS